MDLYAQNVMDHYKNPRHSGQLSDSSATRHEVNKTCGDEIDVDVKVEDGRLVDLAFRGEGCAISQAAMSILAEEIVGMAVEEVLQLQTADVRDMMGIDITARRMKCAVLGLLAVQNALLVLGGSGSKSFADLLV